MGFASFATVGSTSAIAVVCFPSWDIVVVIPLPFHPFAFRNHLEGIIGSFDWTAEFVKITSAVDSSFVITANLDFSFGWTLDYSNFAIVVSCQIISVLLLESWSFLIYLERIAVCFSTSSNSNFTVVIKINLE